MTIPTFRQLAAALSLAALSGCAHTLYVLGPTPELTGKTTVTTTPGQSGGSITLVLGGETYTGRWVYMRGGSFSLASMTATNGLRTVSATGSAMDISAVGSGTLIMSAPDGSHLRCVFNYSGWSSSGLGVCEDDKGRRYDLQIN